MKRRQFIAQTTMASASLLAAGGLRAGRAAFPVVRVAEGQRKFKSIAVEQTIATIKKRIGNQEIAWLFENCFPNTLDTTVDFSLTGGKPDTYVITGDIDAMWLRDSTAQVWPYLSLLKEDRDLRALVAGVIRRQTKCILKDPYANAFYKDENKVSEWKQTDLTDMKAGIHERKWEIDSLCYPIRLAHGYWKQSGDTSPFDSEWAAAMKTIVRTFREQQRLQSEGPYSFQRKTDWATDGVPLGGYGYPTKKVGLIHSMFRPSDDATIYPFLIPSNCFAAVSLKSLSEMSQALLQDLPFSRETMQFSTELQAAIARYGTLKHPVFGTIYAYETNGFGSYNLMDDANVPSLLALPYLNYTTGDDPTYRNTRRYVLSLENPFFFRGTAGEGIGGPHAGMDMIWPLSIIMRGLTSSDQQEIAFCLKTLQHSHGGTGFMHESFHKNDETKYTRKWFAWANTLLGEFILKVYRENPRLLD